MKVWMSLNSGQIPSLTTELATLENLKNILSPGFLCNFYQIFLILEDNQNWPSHSVSSSELPAFEYHKLWYLHTLCMHPGEVLCPLGY